MAKTDFDMTFGNMGGGIESATFGTDLPWDDLGVTNSFTSINDPSAASTSTRTVSPKDIMSDPLASAPPSAAFTNLTSPDLNDSPFDSYETSPLFNPDGDLGANDSNGWFSLFPESNPDPPIANPLERTASERSQAQSSSSGTGSPIVLDAARRTSVATDRSPTSHSAVSGVKSRRRKPTLSNIQYDPSDKVAMKRARNTLAARHSRQRKLDHVQSLEETIRKLEEEKDAALREAAEWKEKCRVLGYSNLGLHS